MVGWHHQLSGHEFEQAPGDSGRQGSHSPERLKNSNKRDDGEGSS